MPCKDIPYNPPEDRDERRKYNAWYNAQVCGPTAKVEHTKVDEEQQGGIKTFDKSLAKRLKQNAGS